VTDSGWDHAGASATLDAPREDVAALFWDIAAWHAIWHGIDDVDVRYDDGVHQEFAMGVQRDGRREDVRTIRYRHDDGDIGFFSPRPPPTMSAHSGAWLFEPDPLAADCCRVRARRDYRLIGAADESETELAVRRRHYRERFEDRLQAILDCFVDHFARRTPEVTA
jgi:hypothetical protein